MAYRMNVLRMLSALVVMMVVPSGDLDGVRVLEMVDAEATRLDEYH